MNRHQARPSRRHLVDDFFRGIDLVDAGALREAYSLLRTYDPPYRLEEFFREGVKRVGVGHAPDFVNAVAAWPDFGTFELVSAQCTR